MLNKFFSYCKIACPQKKRDFFHFFAIFGDFFSVFVISRSVLIVWTKKLLFGKLMSWALCRNIDFYRKCLFCKKQIWLFLEKNRKNRDISFCSLTPLNNHTKKNVCFLFSYYCVDIENEYNKDSILHNRLFILKNVKIESFVIFWISHQGGEEGPPQQFLVRATFSSFFLPSHLEILVLRLMCLKVSNSPR